jgi:hypothetical protein
MKCYLPWRGEFGWMIMCFVKKFHADPDSDKLICCKPGHECLFPTATHFFYDWQDLPDNKKAGANTEVKDEGSIKRQIISQYPGQQHFASLKEIGWHNKHSFAKHTFIPKSKHNLGLKADVVLAPRKREIDVFRNWSKENWQIVATGLANNGASVGVIGTKETSFELDNVAVRSYDHIDVDSDVELINNAKLVITQESGMQYLAFMCQKPVFHIDRFEVSHEHRSPNIPFRDLQNTWGNPDLLVKETLNFLKDPK